jgi:zinc transporter, ZIP family
MREAFFWGFVGGSSLVIGGVIARRVSLTARHVGLIMAFGAGVLISAVAYDWCRKPGKLAGFITTVGFAVAFGISALQ